MMSSGQIMFYVLSAFVLVSGLLAVTARKIFRSAIYLLFALTGIAGIYFLMQYEFLAAVQIIVYVGGIVVLIIFSIFLTQQSGAVLPAAMTGRKLFAVLASVFGFLFLAFQFNNHPFQVVAGNNPGPSMETIGKQMLNVTESGYSLPFEVVSLLLLAAMIGCIVIALKDNPVAK